MDNLTRWIFGFQLDNIESYESLKELIVNHAKRDYLFFPFLIGYVERFLSGNNESFSLKEMTLMTIYDLLIERKIKVFFVDSKEMELANWESQNELNAIIERIKFEWDKCGNVDPEVNQVIWITA